MNGAAARPILFIEHSLTVLTLVAGVTLVGNWNKPKSFHRAITNNMKRLSIIILFCLFACIEAQAASFDCAKEATSTQRKIICENEELSRLDARFGMVSRVVIARAVPDRARWMMDEQIRWQQTVRDQCADAACLLAAYKAELDKVDPLADRKLTCEEMKQFPEIVFSPETGPDLGSGTNAFDDVDYNCPDSLSQQEFMQRLMALAEKIRGQDGLPQSCTGSIVHAQRRSYSFSLTKAGFFPGILQEMPPRTALDWNPPKVIRYFKQWSEQSLSNHALYWEFVYEFDRVLPILSKHYQDHSKMSEQEAQIAARAALMLVVERAAGGFPRAQFKEDSTLVQAVRDSRSDEEDIRREISRVSEDDIYDALVVALISSRPLKTVSILAEALRPEVLQRIDDKKEPLLSFAIGSPRNLEYLLSKKVPVDAANGFGKTALFYAVSASNYEAVEILLKAGADVNHAYKSAKELEDLKCVYPLEHTRRTPLMHAAQHSDVRMVDMLVKAGAWLDAVDDLGYNALDYVTENYIEGVSSADIEKYLKSLGLEYGASKHNSSPNPAVREQTVR